MCLLSLGGREEGEEVITQCRSVTRGSGETLVTVYSAHTATCDHKEARNTIDDFIDSIASCYIIAVTLSTLR